jgi:hypothetical protein
MHFTPGTKRNAHFGNPRLFGPADWTSLSFMKLRTRMMISALLTLPALSFAGDHAAATPSTPKPALDLKAASVQSVVRNHAVAQTAGNKPLPDESAPTDIKPLPFRAPRRVHHVDCDSFNCVAYTADNDALFSVPRDQYFGVTEDGGTRDSWLACQSGDDLLTTFERYDKCRGISVGIPVQFRDVTVNVPVLGR